MEPPVPNNRPLAFFGLNGYLLFALILVVYTAARFVHLPLSGWEFVVALVLAAGVKLWFYSRLAERPRVRTILAVEVGFAVMFLLALAAVTVFYDKSFDGRAYHQETILQLMDGYNPIYGSVDEARVPGALWINHYAKGCEAVAAVLYALTADMEAAKVFGLVFLLSNIALGISVLGRWGRLPRGWATVVSLILALNPVVVNQIWTPWHPFGWPRSGSASSWSKTETASGWSRWCPSPSPSATSNSRPWSTCSWCSLS